MWGTLQELYMLQQPSVMCKSLAVLMCWSFFASYTFIGQWGCPLWWRLLQTCSACHWPYSSFEPYGSVKVGTGKLYTSYFKRFGILNKLSSALLQAGDMMNEFNHLSAEMWCNFLFWHQSDEQEVWLVHYFGASSWKWFRCHQGLG